MLLIPNRQRDGRLFLDAYSYSDGELNAVSEVLSKVGLQSIYDGLPTDSSGRKGRRYIIQAVDMPKVEEHLSVKFEGTENNTITVIVEGEGEKYSCQEMCLHGDGDGCVNITANSSSEAIVKCSLEAKNRGWLGGVASPGPCTQSQSLFSMGGFLGRLLHRSN